MEKILYITGSFPRLGDGIGDAAGKLYSSMIKEQDLLLVTTDIPGIRNYIEENKYKNVLLVPNWRLGTVIRIFKLVRKNRIKKILIEYAGNGYRKDLFISFFPFFTRIWNLFGEKKIECHLRLHEYTMCRIARKIFTWPLVKSCHHLDTPSFVEYEYLKKKFGNKVFKSGIGSNINWTDSKKALSEGKVNLGFFGGIYPGKGIENLLKIWSELEQKYPEHFQYYLLGGFPQNLTSVFDHYQEEIQRLIHEKGLSSKIIITGFLPEKEIEKQLDMIDIAVLPYEDGLTLRRGSFLAFLCRNVAVVTSSGDTEARELFKDADGIKMCTNEQEMIDAILDYSKQGKYYAAGLSNGQFRKYFDWDNIAEKVLKLFH